MDALFHKPDLLFSHQNSFSFQSEQILKPVITVTIVRLLTLIADLAVSLLFGKLSLISSKLFSFANMLLLSDLYLCLRPKDRCEKLFFQLTIKPCLCNVALVSYMVFVGVFIPQ